MKVSNTTLTATQIREINIEESDVLGYDFRWENDMDNYYLCVNGERKVSFIKSSDRTKTYDKIKRMGMGLGWKAPLLTDEEEGIIQAHNNGENPFAYSIICANPAMNKVVR